MNQQLAQSELETKLTGCGYLVDFNEFQQVSTPENHCHKYICQFEFAAGSWHLKEDT